jgi:hypothetical protein
MSVIPVPFHRDESEIIRVLSEIGEFCEGIEDETGDPVFAVFGGGNAGDFYEVQHESVQVFLPCAEHFAPPFV